MVLAALFSSPIRAGQCPNYSITDSVPTLPYPEHVSFRKWANHLLSVGYAPYHMVHDQIVAEGSAATIIGKFDYDLVMHKDLEGEYVHVYLYGTDMTDWEHLGRYTTDDDGKVYVTIPSKKTGDYIVRMVVEGDLTSATGYLSVVSPNRQTVLFDIDGTLTTNDFEAVGEYLGVDTADTYPYAADVVNAYINSGYQVVFLSGRPYWVVQSTRIWFDSSGIKPWHLHTNPNSDNVLNMQTQAYKTAYIKYLQNDVGLKIIRAYGNALTDIAAYADAGIAPEDTYIIGEHAGKFGTHALNGSYKEHYHDVILTQPAAVCSILQTNLRQIPD